MQAIIYQCIFNFHDCTFHPLRTNVPHHKETTQLICNGNELTSFYIMGNIARKWLAETFVRGCSVKKLFLKNSLKRDPNTGAFLCTLRNL